MKQYGMKKEVFICDNCGTRNRLNSAQRHWCALCLLGSPLEMRPARDKRILHGSEPLVSAIPASSQRPQTRVLFGSQPCRDS